MDFHKERIIVLVDMDCFYVQVEQKLCPEYQNRPCAVVQYNTWKGGGIIAVNYEARAQGVARRGRGEDAQRACPDIHLFRVPEVRGKADLTRYREAGASVMEVLCKFCDCVERASIDEAYLDMTDIINQRLQNDSHVTSDQIPNTFVIGWENKENEKRFFYLLFSALESWLQMIYEEDHLYHDRMLAVAAVIVEEMRAAVLKETGYKCSAGIAQNKFLSKLSCGLHKPNKQTVLPQSSIPLLYKTIPIKKVRNLGGKLGDHVMQKFNVNTMGDLLNLSKSQFINGFGDKTGSWLYNLSRGIENEPVTPRQLPKSIGCGKNFPGKSCLDTKEKVLHWVKQLSSELEERLIKDQENNRRIARILTVCVRNTATPGYSTVSKSCPIYIYNAEKIAHDAFAAVQKFNSSSSSNSSWNPAILSLAMSAGKFEDKIDTSNGDIQTYFNNAISPSKKIDNASAQSSSDIDTVLNLMDTEPVLTKDTTSKKFDCHKNNQKTLINQILSFSAHKSKDITKFSSDPIPSTSKSDISIKENAANEFQIISKSPESIKVNESKSEEAKDISSKILNNINSVTDSSLPNGKNTLRKDPVKNVLHNSDQNEPSVISDISLNKQASLFCGASTSYAKNSLPGHSELDPELTKLCPKCNRQIPIWEEEEHEDYHVALDLSKELMKEPVIKNMPSVNTAKSTVIKRSKTTRKRGSTTKSVSKPKKLVQQNTLDSFFKCQ
ncbi:DNA polymerase eta [Caerostris extrusa]|uniref:DNA polymerase eta n=1 Tax=Caerostris extrusa TaxID=172846 RepID=A0AAV4MYV2_CAEEX|nr:DNA polymerase eta [Caerostris extrusa]